jgi:HEAT repeats
MRTWLLTALLSIAASSVSAQDDDESTELAGDKHALITWLRDYRQGAVRMVSRGRLVEAEMDRARKLIMGVSRHDSLDAAKLLFKIATLQVEQPGTSRSSTSKVDFFGEIRITAIRSMARKNIAGMHAQEVEDWLLTVARKKKGGDFKSVTNPAGAALRILASRPSPKAKAALLAGCRSLKPEVRVQAVNSLSMNATIELVPHFLDLVRDKEPYVRIAAFNGLGRGLAAHTDETIHKKIDLKVAKQRDAAIEVMRKAMLSDRVWQVRAAARENLAALKSKFVIPALIDGLRAELGRKKDPWALDIRLHRTLEGLTGQKMPVGQTRIWEDFWKKEAATFAFAPAGMKVADTKKKSKYEKFFNLELESNRVLFVVDFSGSMIENITLKTKGVGTAASGGERTTTKARLVVEELKKMVMTLKDGDLFNIIVFSDDVRMWRPGKDGRPALVKMNDELRDDLLGGYLDNLQPAGMTNLYGALDMALGIGGRGLHDKYYGLGYDTLYVLSDGAPTKGKVTDTKEILRIVRERNALTRLTIHTITFGFLNQMIFLKKLAIENGGRHIHIE